MIKFTGAIGGGGTMYGFGLTDANLNRMQYNNEPIFFDFGYADHPELFGLIAYMGEFATPEDMLTNLGALRRYTLPFYNRSRGVTPETLCFFPLARSIVEKFRSTPLWGFEGNTQIAHPNDKQIFFSGRSEQELEAYFQVGGFITAQTKRTKKGFGVN